jgi:hypothetical protein
LRSEDIEYTSQADKGAVFRNTSWRKGAEIEFTFLFRGGHAFNPQITPITQIADYQTDIAVRFD